MYLPDVNAWLALAFEAHADHTTALAWFGPAAEKGCAFCRMTQQGFLRLATNPAAFGDEAVTCAQAWALYDQFQAEGLGARAACA
jgi:predicted nucleic acid-binding protein